jgi:hypothetical protein
VGDEVSSSGLPTGALDGSVVVDEEAGPLVFDGAAGAVVGCGVTLGATGVTDVAGPGVGDVVVGTMGELVVPVGSDVVAPGVESSEEHAVNSDAASKGVANASAVNLAAPGACVNQGRETERRARRRGLTCMGDV